MEMANQSQSKENSALKIRVATRSDASGVMELLQTAQYRHIHVDWYLPGDWIGAPSFLVQTKKEPEPSRKTLTTQLFGPKNRIQACFAATADPHPAAWVRLAAVTGELEPEETIKQLCVPAIAYLKGKGVTQIGWLALDTWPNKWITKLGFAQENELITFRKEDVNLPDIAPYDGMIIRSVLTDDFERLAEIERLAYTPLWRHSAHAFKMAHSQLFSFDVAILDDVIVGFQLSARGHQGAHLARLTIDPAYQRRGIGSALLAHTLKGYHNRGLVHVSLNTQMDNVASQLLYKKFGFVPTQDSFPVWVMNL